MVTDPYKTLNISSSASDDEVKKAYRELARKYHPDNYHGSPLEATAEEKMKEINEAYAMIQKARKGEADGTQSQGSYGWSGASSNPLFQQVRLAINRGDLTAAEQLLKGTDLRNAEWHFLIASVYYRRGWLDEAMKEYQMACNMDPGNAEYRQAYEFMRNGGTAYRPEGYGTGGIMNCSPWECLICGGILCSVCSGGRICIC